MKFKEGDSVQLIRDIRRHENLNYAKAGETGTIVGVFPTKGGSVNPDETRWHAKVKMKDGTIKTFRFTSLLRLSR